MLHKLLLRTLSLLLLLSFYLFPLHLPLFDGFATTVSAASLPQDSPPDSETVGEFILRLPALRKQSTVALSPNTRIAAGDQFTCALSDSGGAYCWGAGGRLGNGTTLPSEDPEPVNGLASGVQALDADGFYACALLTDHSVRCWGAFFVTDPFQVAGALPQAWQGDLVPVVIEGFAGDVAAISVNASGGCALLATGVVQCWSRWAPEQMETVAGLEGEVIAIAKGFGHQCALLQDGIAECWGGNLYGQLGDGGGIGPDRTTPAEVPGLEGRVSAIAAGGYNSCALLEGGTVRCWGKRINNDNYTGLTPTAIEGIGGAVAGIDVGFGHSCALLEGGEVYCWGENDNGQLGDGSTDDSTTAVKVVDLEGAIAIELGDTHSCALLENLDIKCWGSSLFGKLGNGYSYVRRNPVAVEGLRGPVATLEASGVQSCVALADGSVQCWGDHSKLENGVSVPKDVTGLREPVEQIAIEAFEACGVLVDGTLQCWNAFDSSPITFPQPAGPVQSVVMDGNTYCVLLQSGGVQCWDETDTLVELEGLEQGVIAIAKAYYHTCVLLDDGTVECWGKNYFGQLGNGTTTDRSTPAAVVGLDGPVEAISLGFEYGCALLQSGAVQCWGRNSYGQLGDGSTTDRLTPVDVTGLGQDVEMIAAGKAHVCALLSGGEVYCWGDNEAGQLGNGNLSRQLTPVKVEQLPDGVVDIDTGDQHSCALLEDGSVRCWGHADYVGDGVDTSRQLTPVDVIWPPS